VGVRLNTILLKEAARKGAGAIVTLCPLCQFNLDAYQSEIRKQSGQNLDMPILYFTQLLGWALGGDPASLGVHRSIAGRAAVKKWFTASKEVAAHV
jgi:heterodisulfide reductase subunit B